MYANQEDFARWISGQPIGRTYKTKSADNCPIATYLKEACGGRTVSVGMSEIVVDDNYEYTPAWAKKFIERFDRNAVEQKDTLLALGIVSVL